VETIELETSTKTSDRKYIVLIYLKMFSLALSPHSPNISSYYYSKSYYYHHPLSKNQKEKNQKKSSPPEKSHEKQQQ